MKRRNFFAAVAAGCGLSAVLPKPTSGISLSGGKNLIVSGNLAHYSQGGIQLEPGVYRGTLEFMGDGTQIYGAGWGQWQGLNG